MWFDDFHLWEASLFPGFHSIGESICYSLTSLWSVEVFKALEEFSLDTVLQSTTWVDTVYSLSRHQVDKKELLGEI
jgi:hypothetical protein